MNAHGGCGTHPDARIALTRALTEAAQTRLGFIQGGREDLPDFAPANGTPPAPTWNRWSHTIRFDDNASYEHPSVNDDVEFIIERMRQSGFDQVVVFDITRAEVGIPVVRVVVPRAEAWTFCLMHGGRASLGPRVLNESKSVAAILRPRELGGPFEMSIRFEHGRIRQMMVSETSSSTPGMRASDEDDCILRSIDC